MNAPNTVNAADPPIHAAAQRSRLVRDRNAAERFSLHPGAMYRVAYLAGGGESRRVSRSLAVFERVSDRRRWDGEVASCLDFVLPQGRALSLLASQLVDVRPTGLNDRGQWVLASRERAPHRRRGARPQAA
jgi:hypothetical protein